MLYFAELRRNITKADAIQIILKDIAEVENYSNITHVPYRYNMYEVYNIANVSNIETDEGPNKGISIVLKETPIFSSIPNTSENIKEIVRNMFK